MEKKTIGKFIQALRRAQGMTQRELADRLYVSDKTVSRWECDECTPELSLIPVIAEIFGITTDELLRGERRTAEATDVGGEDNSKRLRVKSEKQFRTMLRNRMTRYKNLSMISFGLLAAGVLAAFICNFAFFRGRLAFFLGLAFIAAGVITEICFSSSARLTLEEEDEAYQKEIETHNRAVVRYKWTRMFMAYLAVVAVFPFITYEFSAFAGIDFTTWIGIELLCLAIALPAVMIVRSLFGSSYLEKYEGIAQTDADRALRRANRKSAKKTLAVFAPIGAVLLVAFFVLANTPLSRIARGEVFEDIESFQAYVATEGKRWTEERYGTVAVITTPVVIFDSESENVDVPTEDPDHDSAGFYDVETLVDGYGNYVCEYVSYFNFIRLMKFSGNDLFPITVYTAEHYEAADNLVNALMAFCAIGLLADIVVGCVVYAQAAKENRKKAVV
ncbi:MAG: helix-turn-helix domain-containing protein [Clostridia bacterium]|nr:helix-turn-helix domain-containing protein [Clostridia bacterium]